MDLLEDPAQIKHTHQTRIHPSPDLPNQDLIKDPGQIKVIYSPEENSPIGRKNNHLIHQTK